jgi:hypothetical protein
MSNQVPNKIREASNVSKNQIVDKIKSEYSVRYDQMIVNTEIERNDVLYVNYRAKYVNVSTQKVIFAMADELATHFELNYTGGESAHGVISELNKDLIKTIKDSKALIAEKSLSDNLPVGSLKNTPTLQFLSKGYMDSKEAKLTADDGEKEEEKSLFGSLKKAMNEPIGGSRGDDDDDDDDDDDYEDIFETVDWFSVSSGGENESTENEYIKNKSLKSLTFEYNGETISNNQPLHFVPQLTKIDNCKVCKGDGEVECPTCKGTGRIKCKGEVKNNPNAGPASNIHYSCKNGKLSDGTHCGTCGGPEKYNGRGGWNPCERKYGSKYGIGKLADRVTGKPYCGGKKVIPCKPCKATGRIGTLVYIKSNVGSITGEFFKYTNQRIEQIEKKPELLYPYLNKSQVNPVNVFTDINGDLTDNYDEYSSQFIPEIESNAGLNKGLSYPRLMLEELYYDVIPMATLEYNHILTATNHQVSAVIKGSAFDILFHSEPTAVKRFSFKNLIKSYFSKWPEAFMTSSYKTKRDKFNEIQLLIHIAKADGSIADEEKVVLANTITGLTEYTASEKSKLFNLMSSTSLPELTENDFVISTRERADLTFTRLEEMAMEDNDNSGPEGKMVQEFKDKINTNIGRYHGKFKQFIKTWQVSLSVLLMLVAGIYSLVFFLYLKPRIDAEKLHQENLTNEKVLKGFITWAGTDTLSNIEFSTYLMDLEMESDEEIDFDGSISSSTPMEVFNKIKHDASYTLDGTNMSYKDFWDNHTKVLKASLDSLMPILKRRTELGSTKNSNKEANAGFTPDDKWYTISDPDGFSNLRETPNGTIIQEVFVGDIFQVIGLEKGFKKIRLADGTEGFVHASRIVEYTEDQGIEDEPTGPTDEDELDSELDPEYQ